MKFKYRVAIVIPIGDINKFGYQYHYKKVLDLYSEKFERIYVVTTTRANDALDFEDGKVTLITHEDALFELDEEGSEKFDIHKIYTAWRVGAESAKSDGFDFVINVAINQCIDTRKMDEVVKYINYLGDKGLIFGWCKKSFLTSQTIYFPNSIVPVIHSLKHYKHINWGIDNIFVRGFSFKTTKFKELHAVPFPEIIDVLGAEVESDFTEKYDWYEKNYRIQMHGTFKRRTFSDHVEKMQKSVLADCEVKRSVDTLEAELMALYPEKSASSILVKPKSEQALQRTFLKHCQFKAYMVASRLVSILK